jgi:hypothetical protein
MSKVPPKRELSSEKAAASSQRSHAPRRVLACVLCQQRKVKCDRKFPCANCTRAQVQCVPATLLPHRRKRRFPERELLERLRKYEDLLRRNEINFDPLHPEEVSREARAPSAEDHETSEDDGDGASNQGVVKAERVYEAKYMGPEHFEQD